jgi:hypothetical protein
MSTAYNDAEFSIGYPAGAEVSYWSLARNHILYRTIKEKKLFNGPIIEIGCARG